MREAYGDEPDRGAPPPPLRGQQPLPRAARAAAGLVFSGTNPDLDLVEFVELPRDVHPYYVATQAHPELRSRPTRPHPLFAGLIGAAIERQKELGSRSTTERVAGSMTDQAREEIGRPADDLAGAGVP